MVQFVNHFFPNQKFDVVEIDPIIVRVARDYFGLKPAPGTRIFIEDAFKYFKRESGRYDVIYMDAFLKPSEATDITGAPRNLKTLEFLKRLHAKLRNDGMVVFNLNENVETEADIRSIRSSFPTVYVLGGPGSGNIVIVGSLSPTKLSATEMRKRGEMLDKQHSFGFPCVA